MARKKVKLAWIASDSARKATLKKRKRGLMKKASELCTLCGITVCAIIYSPKDPHPDIWPPLPEAKQVLHRFNDLPEMDQVKKMLNQEAFLKQRISKLREQLTRLEKENREREISILMYEILAGNGLNYLNMEVLSALTSLIDSKMKTVRERIEFLKVPPISQLSEENMALDMAIEAYQKQQWLMEMMNTNEFMGSGVEDPVTPFGYASNPWFDASFL